MIPAAGYIRVSREREGMISPAIQRQQIEGYAARAGFAVVSWYQDLDISGRKLEERPDLQRLLMDAREGMLSTVIVYRLDRFSREPRHYYSMVYELEEAGVELHDSSEGRYFPGPEMNLMRGLKMIMGNNESLTLGIRMRDMHKKLAQSGAYVGGTPPYGWQRVRENGEQRLVLHPEHAPIRRKMHELVWQGWSLTKIALYLRDHAIPTPRGGQWKASKVSEMLSSPLQYGARVSGGEEVISGRIEPLVTREEYEHTRAVLAGRKRWAERTSPRALRGNLVRCGNCGATMHLHTGRQKVTYRCEGVDLRACDHGADIREHLLWGEVEPQVLKRLAHLKPPKMPKKRGDDIQVLLDAEEAARAALGRLVAMWAAGDISEDEWTHGRAKANERLDAARKRVERGRRELEAPSVEDYQALQGVSPEVWRALPPDDQNSVLRLLIEYVAVNPRGVPPRIDIHWR